MAEIGYILINEAMPGLVKVGHTTGDLATRIRTLSSSTGVPLAFELFYACEVPNALAAEREIHDAFDDHRVSRRREFFRIAPERVKSALAWGVIREVMVGDDAFETEEDKEEVEIAKKRSAFQFAMIGMEPGTELKLEKDPTVTCTTVDDRNKVQFRGEVTSLSSAALTTINDLRYDWTRVSGPWAWTYKGKRLDDIRREIEEAAD